MLPFTELPKRRENCSPITSFAQEVEDARQEKQKSAPQPIHVKIQSFTVQPIDSLPDVIATEVAARVRSAVDRGELSPDWTEEISSRVQAELQHYGYFYAFAKPATVKILSRTNKFATVSINVRVEAHAIYRLGEITFEHGTAFSPERMRELFPIKRGEIFDTSKIAEGIESLRRVYGELGYIDFSAVPATQNDPTPGLLNLTFELAEGPQFRVGNFEILGIKEADAQKLIAESGLRPGNIFNALLVQRFFDTNKSALPSDANADEDTEYRRHDGEGTVDVILDFRRCR